MLTQPRLIRRSPRGLWLPGGQPQIDWTNPITEGLVGCWVTTGEGGAAPVIRDLVSQIRLPSSGTPRVVAGPAGMEAQDLSGSSGYWGSTAAGTAGYPVSQQPTTAASCLWFGRAIAAVSGNTALICDSSTTLQSNWGFIRNTSAAQVLYCYNELGAQVTYSSALVTGGYSALLGSAGPAGGQIWQSGVRKAVTATAMAANSYSSHSIWVGKQPNGGSFAGAGMCVGALWNRQLTPGESSRISADPTNFLVFPGDLVWGQMGGSNSSTIFLDYSIPSAWSANERLDAIAPIEFPTAIHSDRGAPLEAVATTRADTNIAAEWLASIRDDIPIPGEWSAAQRTDRAVPAEWLSTTRADQIVPVEWGGSFRSDDIIPAEWSGNIRSDTVIPIERLTVLNPDNIAALEQLGTASTTDQIPVEWLALSVPIMIDYPAPIEWLSGERSDQAIAAEHLIGVSGDHLSPIELAASSAWDILVPIEVLSTTQPISVTYNVPVEWLAYTRVDTVLDFESGAAAIVTYAVPVEWIPGQPVPPPPITAPPNLMCRATDVPRSVRATSSPPVNRGISSGRSSRNTRTPGCQ